MYRGDTPGKKLARLETWRATMDMLGEDRFVRGRHLFLSGPTCGDASVLQGLGVPPGNLLAVDRDEESATAAKRLFPMVDVRHEDVLTTVEREKRGFDSIFLDFCQPILDATLDTTALAMLEGLAPYGVLSCAFLAGREVDGSGGRREAILLMRDRLMHALEKAPEAKQRAWEGSLSYLARGAFLHGELVNRARKYSLVPVPFSYVFYKSRIPTNVLPMIIYSAIVVPNSVMGIEHPLRHFKHKQPEYYFLDPTPKDLGEYAIRLEKSKQNAALLLNATKATVAAWKANATRGAYK